MAQIVNARVPLATTHNERAGALMEVIHEGGGATEVPSGVARMRHLPRRTHSSRLAPTGWQPTLEAITDASRSVETYETDASNECTCESTWTDPATAAPAQAVSPRTERVNRALNVLLAASVFLLVLPLMLLIAIAVKLTSCGPVLYAQVRVGVDRRRRAERRMEADRRSGVDRRMGLDRRGRPADRRVTMNRRAHVPRSVFERRLADIGGRAFRIYKFRSMCVNAERTSGAVWATRNDPRVTRLGRLLRHFRVDELPQLYNVLKGDMNIVGPRPERPSLFRDLKAAIPEYTLRQRARPGITGWAQVKQSYDACVDDVRRKVGFDLEYLRRRSLWVDLGIIARTIPVMLFKRGAC